MIQKREKIEAEAGNDSLRHVEQIETCSYVRLQENSPQLVNLFKRKENSVK